MKANPGLPEDILEYAEDAWIVTAAIGAFDHAPDQDEKLVRITGPAWYSRNNRFTQAEQAASVGDLDGAIAHLRRAIELVPSDAATHAYLGAFLGQLMQRDGRVDLVAEALTELHVAVQLAPEEKMPAHEIGVVLGNCGRHAEAEEAFAHAATVCAKWALFHENRGWNLLVLRRLDDAYASYRRAIELEPNRVECRVRLVAICMATDREQEARSHALCVRHLTHRDPLRNWRMWMNPLADWLHGDRRQ